MRGWVVRLGAPNPPSWDAAASVATCVQSFVRRPRRTHVVKRVAGTAPAAVRPTKRVAIRGACAQKTLVVRREGEGDHGTAATETSDAARGPPYTDTLPPAFLAF